MKQVRKEGGIAGDHRSRSEKMYLIRARRAALKVITGRISQTVRKKMYLSQARSDRRKSRGSGFQYSGQLHVHSYAGTRAHTHQEYLPLQCPTCYLSE